VIGAVTALRATTDSIRCPSSHRNETLASRVRGRWSASASAADLVSAHVPPGDAEQQRGGGTLVLQDGRWVGRERLNGFVWRGRYAVDGNVLRLITKTCPQSVSCSPESIATFTWSVYDDRLSLALVSGTPSYFGLIAVPLTRIG
jgi:hypothetical protein